MNPQTIQALIFDFDDTIVESEKLNIEIIYECYLKNWDVTLDYEDGLLVYGHSWQDVYRHHNQKYGIEADIFDVQAKVLETKYDYLKTHKLPIAQGLERILALPQRKVIVTGSGNGEIDAMLDNIGAKGAFEKWFTIEDYVHGKPDPAGFLMALDYLEISPANALVIEDSGSGLKAGKAANIPTAFVAEFAVCDQSKYADRTFANLNELVDWLTGE